MATEARARSRPTAPARFTARQSGLRRRRFIRRLRLALLGLALLVVLFPLAFLIATSFRPSGEFMAVPPRLLPQSFTLDHYEAAFTQMNALRFLLNSLTVAGVTTAISVAAGTLAAYALARSRLPTWVLTSIVFVFIFIRFYPRIATVLPWFLIVRDLGLLDTVWAVIFGHLGITIPFVTWLMLVMFRGLSEELEEAGAIDGANVWQRFFYIVLPMVTPGVASAAIFTAFLSWNEFLIASSVTRESAKVLPVAVAGFVTDRGVEWGPMSAMSVVIIIPMVIFAFTVQRYLVKGLTLGATKG